MNSVLKAADSRTVRRQAGRHFYYAKFSVTLLSWPYCDFVEKIDLVQVSLEVASKLYYFLFKILRNSIEKLEILEIPLLASQMLSVLDFSHPTKTK